VPDGRSAEGRDLSRTPSPVAAVPHRLRDAFRRHPEGVTIVTAIDQFGNQMGITATGVASVSLDPPLLLFCVNNRSWMVGPLVAGGSFVVHFLGADQEELAERFASFSADKFEGVSYRLSSTGCPRLDGCLAALHCEFESAHPGGDHTVVMGRVIDVQLGPRAGPSLAFLGGRLLPVG
jgi:flavin reductase (DIM6/NTAB) family NADH-FMN oxidoreductase RutF